MRILLLGANGLLGRHLGTELTAHGHELTAQSHAEADITDAVRLDELFCRPWDAVINAAAICDFDACENEPERTGRVNLEAPLDLARRCCAYGAQFVQFSSDYVFDGAEDRLLTEEDAPAPLSVYGRQKAGIEQKVPVLCPKALVLRIAWLYGEGGRTFMSLLPSLLARQEVLRVAAGKRGCCLHAADAARWVRVLIEQRRSGLINLVNTGETSWEEFARTCRDRMEEAGWPVKCRTIEEVPYSDLGPHWGKRPRFSALDTSRLRELVPPGPRPWQEALGDFLHPQKSIAAPPPL